MNRKAMSPAVKEPGRDLGRNLLERGHIAPLLAMLMKVDGLLAKQGPSARHSFSSRSELSWQTTYSSDLFVIAAGQNGLYPCTYCCTRRLDSRFVGACVPSGDRTGTQAVMGAVDRFIESGQ